MNNKKTIYLVSIGALVLLLIVGILAYIYRDELKSLFTGASTATGLDWGGYHQGAHPYYPCLAPVRTQLGQTFNLDTEERFKLYNRGTTVSKATTVVLSSDKSILVDSASVTVSSGTYSNGIWSVPPIQPGKWEFIRVREPNMLAQAFSLSAGSISTECRSNDFFPVIENTPAPAITPAPAPVADPINTNNNVTNPQDTGSPVPPKSDTQSGTSEVKGATILEKVSEVAGGTKKGSTGNIIIPPGGGDLDPPVPGQQCAINQADIDRLGMSARVLKNEAVVNILTDGCITLRFTIFKLGPNDEVLPYAAQDDIETKEFTLGRGTHYLNLAALPCSFQSDLYIAQSLDLLAYDWLEHGCPPAAQTLTCSPASQPIVVGQPVNFTASGGTGTFAWTATGGTPASGAGSTFSTTYSSTGAKTVTVTSGTQSANCGVTVSPAATLTCTPSTQSVAIGQAANFSASGDEGKGLYQWTATGGSPASGSGVNFSTVYTSTGTKIVSVTNGGVSAANCSVTVTSTTAPTLACSPATQSVAVNQNATFTGSGRGDGTSISYSWTATSGNPSGGTGTTFQTRYSTPGTYTVSVRDGSVSRDCSVVVTGQTTTSQITCSPADQTVAIGQAANFSASGDEGKGLYQWTSTGGSPASGIGVTYSTSYSTEGRKTVTVTNGGVSTASCSVTVTATTAPTLACSPANQSVLVNQNATFTGTGRGDGTSISYSWTATGGTPSGGTGTTFQTRYSSPGTYTVSVRDGSVSRDCSVVVTGITLTQSADLSLTKIANPTTLLVNNLVVFSITVENAGPNTATGVSVSDVLPSTLTFNAAVASQGNYNSADGVWTIGAINSGANASLLITARPNQTGTIVNTAEVTASSLPDPDSTPNNHNANEDDQDSATITVTAGGGGCTSNCGGGTPALVCTPSSQTVPTDQNATLVASGGTGGYSWSAPGGSVTSGVNASFTTSYSSTGSKVVTLTSGGVNANCTVVVSAGGGGGGGGGGSSPVCSPTSQTVTVGQTVNYSATGGNGAYSWQATGGATSSGTLASFSTSYATPGTYNVVLTSNGLQATCNAIVQAAPTGSLDLAVNKAVNNSTPVVGQQVTYTISLTNNSTVNATGVTVRDLLPTSVTYTSSFTTQGSYDNATGIWTIGSLPAGDSVSLLITVKVNVLGSIENTAAMTTVDQTDTNSGNNTSTVTITVNAAPSLPAAGANTTASILAGVLFMLLAFVARFFMQTTKATVVATTAESSIKTFTRFD